MTTTRLIRRTVIFVTITALLITGLNGWVLIHQGFFTPTRAVRTAHSTRPPSAVSTWIAADSLPSGTALQSANLTRRLLPHATLTPSSFADDPIPTTVAITGLLLTHSIAAGSPITWRDLTTSTLPSAQQFWRQQVPPGWTAYAVTLNPDQLLNGWVTPGLTLQAWTVTPQAAHDLHVPVKILAINHHWAPTWPLHATTQPLSVVLALPTIAAPFVLSATAAGTLTLLWTTGGKSP